MHSVRASQTQHSSLLDFDQAGGRFQKLNTGCAIIWRSIFPSSDWRKRAAMSPRNFARAYAAETGATPAKAVERMRLEAARAELEHGRSIQDIARRTGFGDVERMRRALYPRLRRPAPRRCAGRCGKR